MFAGRFDHALDEKGRTMMPKRFRDRLAVTDDRTVWMVVVRDGGKHLEVRPNGAFRAAMERVSKAPTTTATKNLKRFYFGMAMEVEVDAAGRLLVPAALRKELELGDRITFVGADENYFEIWQPEALDAAKEAMEGNPDDVLANLAELGL